MKRTKNLIKAEVMQRVSHNLIIKGVMEADVTDMWEDNSKELMELFKFSDWQFVKLEGGVFFRQEK